MRDLEPYCASCHSLGYDSCGNPCPDCNSDGPPLRADRIEAGVRVRVTNFRSIYHDHSGVALERVELAQAPDLEGWRVMIDRCPGAARDRFKGMTVELLLADDLEPIGP